MNINILTKAQNLYSIVDPQRIRRYVNTNSSGIIIARQQRYPERNKLRLTENLYTERAIIPKEQQSSICQGREPKFMNNELGLDVEVYFSEFSYDGKSRGTGVIKQCDDGKYRLHNAKGALYNTDVKNIRSIGSRIAIKNELPYVVTPDGRLLILDDSTGRHFFDKYVVLSRGHGVLVQEKPVMCAGMIKVKDGRITKMSAINGTYRMSQQHLYNAVKLLDNVISKSAKIVSSHKVVDDEMVTYKESKESFLKKMEKKLEERDNTPSQENDAGNVKSKKLFSERVLDTIRGMVHHKSINISGQDERSNKKLLDTIRGTIHHKIANVSEDGKYTQKVTESRIAFSDCQVTKL
ncbi:hypothetical protein [Candidatus Neoehrlichia procyonis]|uniref:Uncharacterized protein n=1 Tax=Candidatus Neoehrlichia procyonis str. RAC413 TaxID=1359163 RepID=A0A0F3NQH9_9RICK|nr:hypothetical protein [Candidatus Neoehrlichia lotoris]KJV69139.1 hypothetical protein NLO413_0515 [Candidatus Neoehrlichia lotoris str. RAC413]